MSANGVFAPGITDGAKAKAETPWLTEAGAASIPVARIVDMLENPGGEFDFNGKRETFPSVKMAYWVGGNPFAHHQDRNRMVKAWQKLETVVVHDFQWTATARFACPRMGIVSSHVFRCETYSPRSDAFRENTATAMPIRS